MNFSDDPLADLSDDNDSFFEEPKVAAKRGSLTKTPDKKSASSLFNIADKPPQPDWLGLGSAATNAPKSPLKAKKISFDDDADGILGGLGLGKKPQAPSAPQVDLLESILGQEKKVPEEPPREGGRRGRRSSGTLLDPLGLFTEPKPPTPKPEPRQLSQATLSKSTPNISENLPDWLAGGGIKPSKSESVLPQAVGGAPGSPALDVSSVLAQQKLAHTQVEFQSTALALQQQESQVLMALQLRKYEENLAGIQCKQQDVLTKQEQQFNLLLERQFAKQQVMENNMRLQQERINNHIQMLIGQPAPSDFKAPEDADKGRIDALKTRHQEEMFLLEDSYKKQLNLMEQTLDSVEKRLRLDVEKLTESFERRVLQAQKEHSEDLDKYKEKMLAQAEQHHEELRQTKVSNARVLDEIRAEHATLLDSLKETRRSESALLQDTRRLDTNIELLHSGSRELYELKDQLERDYGTLSKAREESLRGQEEEVKLMKAALEKCRESAEGERAELLSLVRVLETKLAEQSHNTREDRWAFQQATATLAARSAALDREAEFQRSSLERERAQLQTLRESLLAEQEKQLLELAEEKLSLAAQRSRYETSSRLQGDFEGQKLKVEMEAAIEAARSSLGDADQEREALRAERAALERLKRGLLAQERKLGARERSVERLAKEAQRRADSSAEAVLEAKSIEERYSGRVRELQQQLLALSAREKKLAEEKIVLAKERLSLSTMARQNKNCPLCAADAKVDDLQATAYRSRFDDVDADITRLRWEDSDESNIAKF